MARRREMTLCRCRQCGRRFEMPASQVRRGRGKYCSRACYRESRAAEWVEITCERCGRTRLVRKIYVDRGQYRFCSDDCRRNRRSTPEQRTKVCVTCGRTFTVSAKFDTRRHCSLACRMRRYWSRCGFCRRWFKAKLHGGKPAVYCCRSCYLKAKLSEPQQLAREALESLGVEYNIEKRVGRYYVDFLIPDRSLVLEIDGEYWHSTERQRAKDPVRDRYLESLGLRVRHIPAPAVVADPIGAIREAVGDPSFRS